MNANLSFGVPGLFEEIGDKRTTLYMVVSGHNSEKGEGILIKRKDLDQLVVGLQVCADMVDSPSINHALENGMIPAKNMEKLVRGLSSGLEFVILAKGPGNSPEEKLSTFLIRVIGVLDEMKKAKLNKSIKNLSGITSKIPITGKVSIPTRGMARSSIYPNTEKSLTFQTTASGVVKSNTEYIETCQACGRPEIYCICSR